MNTYTLLGKFGRYYYYYSAWETLNNKPYYIIIRGASDFNGDLTKSKYYFSQIEIEQCIRDVECKHLSAKVDYAEWIKYGKYYLQAYNKIKKLNAFL